MHYIINLYFVDGFECLLLFFFYKFKNVFVFIPPPSPGIKIYKIKFCSESFLIRDPFLLFIAGKTLLLRKILTSGFIH